MPATFSFATTSRFSKLSLNWFIGMGMAMSDCFNSAKWDYLFESSDSNMAESFLFLGSSAQRRFVAAGAQQRIISSQAMIA
jgi:hypothetical protein